MHTNHLQASLLLGQILLNKGEITEAVKELDRAYRLEPSTAQSLYVRALLDLAQSDSHPLQERWNACQRILDDIEPQHEEALKTEKSLAREKLSMSHVTWKWT